MLTSQPTQPVAPPTSGLTCRLAGFTATFALLWASVFLSVPAALASTALPPDEAYKPVLLDAADLAHAHGRSISALSLAAIVDDAAEPIPYQIDEYNIGGAVYFDAWDIARDGEQDVFDAQDKLLFLFRDAGPRRQSHHQFDGQLLAEIQVTGTDGVHRYVYLLENSRLRSDEQYVRYASQYGRVETDFYTLTYEPDNHLIWKDFEYVSFVGEAPLDSMKIRVNTGIILPQAKIELNTDAFIGKPVAERVGPIRTTTQLEITAILWNVPFVKVSAQLHHYPNALIYDVRLVVPEARRMLMVDPNITVSLHGNNLLGMTVRTALGPATPGVVDGVIDAVEQQMMESGISIDENWIWASSKRGLDILSFLEFIGDSRQPVSLYYVDDKVKEDPPQRFTGQLPNIGYTINDFPRRGVFGVIASAHFSSGYTGTPTAFVHQTRTSPDIIVRSIRTQPPAVGAR